MAVDALFDLWEWNIWPPSGPFFVLNEATYAVWHVEQGCSGALAGLIWGLGGFHQLVAGWVRGVGLLVV